MIADKMKFFLGLGLLSGFAIILLIMFSPVLQGNNVLEYLDTLYNSISKGSAYYIPEVEKELEKLPDERTEVSLTFEDEKQAEQAAQLFAASGAEAVSQGSEVIINGRLRGILEKCLEDAAFMYNNNGSMVSGRYGYDERHVLYTWWKSLKALEKTLAKQELFKEAKMVTLVQEKVVEPSYNYYGVEPQKIADRLGVVIISLLFYIVYTIWFGYAIMYIFEGWGLSLSHH